MSSESMTPAPAEAELRACPCCGLPQWVPQVEARLEARCPRCRTPFAPASGRSARNAWAAAAAGSALLVYPLAVGLPILEIERFGHAKASSVGAGAVALLHEGAFLAGAAVLVCSVVFPLLKLAGILAVTAAPERLTSHARARTWHFVEFVGRWGMLDVLLVALLVAMLKLGDLVKVTPGPGLAAFTVLVGLSLLASACYDPHALWNSAQGGDRDPSA
ncbi:paraquat-inducible protein A [Engelhardtia mirabilis]